MKVLGTIEEILAQMHLRNYIYIFFSLKCYFPLYPPQNLCVAVLTWETSMEEQMVRRREF